MAITTKTMTVNIPYEIFQNQEPQLPNPGLQNKPHKSWGSNLQSQVAFYLRQCIASFTVPVLLIQEVLAMIQIPPCLANKK